MMSYFPMKSVGTFVAMLVLALGSSAAADNLRIGGTGVALGGMEALGAAFEQDNPGVSVDVLPSLGSSGGVKALVAAAIDLSVSARPMKDKETAQGAVATHYASTPLALVTSSRTLIDGLTTDDLQSIYRGDLTEWPGGQRIRLVLRPEDETASKILRSISQEMADADDKARSRPGMNVAVNDQDNAELLEEMPGSLGVVAIGQIATEKRQLKVLALDSVLPEPGNTKNVFPDVNLYLVSTDGISPLAARFREFVLSPEGQNILAALDHTPAR